jgi:hypothetical protein
MFSYTGLTREQVSTGKLDILGSLELFWQCHNTWFCHIQYIQL